jgi:subtilase family serine protease
MQTRRSILSTTILAAALLSLPSFAQVIGVPTVTTATQGIALSQLLSAGDAGQTPVSTPLTVRMGLLIQNNSALQQYIQNINTPGNPLYEQSLTPAEFKASYAPSDAQVQQVVSFLEGAGFSNIQVEPNNLIVSADGTVAIASAAFNTRFESYNQFGNVVFGNTMAPQVPASLSGIVGAVLGLNTVGMMKPTLAVPSVPNYLVSYEPKDFLQIYDGTAAKPANQVRIAIMAEGDLTQVVKDLRIAEQLFGTTQVPYKIVQVGVASTDTSGMDEFDLDTQYSTGMAGNVKMLYIYDATSLTDSDLALEFSRFVTDDKAQAGSASLGECEVFPYIDGSMLVDDESFAEAAAQGQTFFASSGDTGSFCPAGPAGANGVPAGAPLVQYPAASQYAIGVGGTTLLTNTVAKTQYGSTYTYNNETSWYAGGGGISQFEASGFWQQAAFLPSKEDDAKAVPDVAYDADPESGANVIVDGSAEGVGGTSLSSPMMLGTWARVLEANPKIGFAGPALYSLYQGTSTSDPVPTYLKPGYHDIILGANGFYPTTIGFDLNTGLGTPDVNLLVQSLSQR